MGQYSVKASHLWVVVCKATYLMAIWAYPYWWTGWELMWGRGQWADTLLALGSLVLGRVPSA